MTQLNKHTPYLLIGFLLLMAALACNAPGLVDDADSAATVGAVYGTITAQAETAGAPLSATDIPANASSTPDQSPPPDDETPTSEPSLTPSLTPTPPETRTGNGTHITLRRCAKEITADGDRTDWDSLTSDVSTVTLSTSTFGASEWSGLDDLSGEALLCWTDAALYLLVTVTDDLHVQTEQGARQWQGDEVELMFDADLKGDFYTSPWNTDDVQVGLSPGDFGDNPPFAYQYHPSRTALNSVTLSARRQLDTGGDYVLEARLPWEVLLGGSLPDAGNRYGMCLALSDNDHPGEAVQDSMVSHCTALAVSDPTTWVTITLES